MMGWGVLILWKEFPVSATQTPVLVWTGDQKFEHVWTEY
jgi:hypothetical protein